MLNALPHLALLEESNRKVVMCCGKIGMNRKAFS